MSAIALIFAGGTGRRMNNEGTPKQFLEVNGKPIILYTLERFEEHPAIDGIVIACLKDYIPLLERLVRQHGLDKVSAVVPGGSTGQASIRNGINAAMERYSPETLVLVHDGVRPLVDPDTISRVVRCAEENGNAFTVAPAQETVFYNENSDGTAGSILDRNRCHLLRAPQCMSLGKLSLLHSLAEADGKLDFIDTASLAAHYGERLFEVEGRPENIKITTPIDYYIFRAILEARENRRIFGV